MISVEEGGGAGTSTAEKRVEQEELSKKEEKKTEGKRGKEKWKKGARAVAVPV
jgi:hypothetical protein